MHKLTVPLFLTLYLILHSSVCIPQYNQRILVYSNTNERTLMPLIEKSLSNLKINGTQLFSQVSNLNEIGAKISSDKIVSKTIDYLYGKGADFSSEARQYSTDISKQLAQYEYFLNITIQKVDSSTYEYHYYLYDNKALAIGDSNFFPVHNVIDPLYKSSFRVNIKYNYEETIKTEAFKMFPAAKGRPAAVITTGTRKKLPSYIIGLGDSIFFNGCYSTNPGFLPATLKHTWYRRNITDSNDILFNCKEEIGNNNSYTFIGSREGSYTIVLGVSDEINNNHEDSAIIVVRKKAELLIHKKKLITRYQRAFFETGGNTFKRSIPVSCSNMRDLDLKNVVLTDDPMVVDTFKIRQEQYKKHKAYTEKIEPFWDDSAIRKNKELEFGCTRTMEGFTIDIIGELQKNYKRKHNVFALINQLKSNTETFSIEHYVYSCLTGIYGIKIFYTSLVSKDRNDTIVLQNLVTTFAFSVRLFSRQPQNIDIDLDVGVGLPLNKHSGYYINSPFYTSLSATYKGFGAGLLYNQLSISSSKTGNNLRSEFGSFGILLSATIKELNSFPLSIILNGGLSLTSSRLPGYKGSMPAWFGVNFKYIFIQAGT